MKKKEYAKEVGMVAAIMADHASEDLYKKMQEKGAGYISTFEQISNWAIEFVDTHIDTDWEEYLSIDIKPKSKKMTSVMCWDDCCIDFIFYKIEHLK
jgi:hypothetical protein